VRQARTSLAEEVERVLGVAAGDRRMRQRRTRGIRSDVVLAAMEVMLLRPWFSGHGSGSAAARHRPATAGSCAS